MNGYCKSLEPFGFHLSLAPKKPEKKDACFCQACNRRTYSSDRCPDCGRPVWRYEEEKK